MFLRLAPMPTTRKKRKVVEMIELRWLVPDTGKRVLQYREKVDNGWSEWKTVPEAVERDMGCP